MKLQLQVRCRDCGRHIQNLDVRTYIQQREPAALPLAVREHLAAFHQGVCLKCGAKPCECPRGKGGQRGRVTD